MSKLKINVDWLDNLIPEGISLNTSTLITGPGGTGKPLVEFAFVAAWLKEGGALISIPLQYPKAELMITAMQKLYNIDLNDYSDKIVFIQFEPTISNYNILNDNILQANLVKPEVWNDTVKVAENMLTKNEKGIMVFGSALNLLLFSDKYSKATLSNLEDIIEKDKSKTYTFAVSTSAYEKEIKILEDKADNLMFTRMVEPLRLFLRIVRMKDALFSGEEIEVPISEEMLMEIKKIAESTRKRKIKEIKNI
ncbi:MAG: hypothetical protein JXA68_06120 [Ignavibacteriales bacterium]|nr:hypothetical protein [Ignavibacteriales bacterium]